MIQPLYTHEEFITFKNLIKKTFTNSNKLFKDLMRYESFHDEFLDKLYELILQSTTEASRDFYDSEISRDFYNETNNLLNDFDNLLNERKNFENENGDYLKGILTLFPDFEELSKQLPDMKILYGILLNEVLLYDLYDDLRSLGFRVRDMKKIYDSYVHWLIESTIIYSYENEILENYKKRNDFLMKEIILASLGDDRRNLKEDISKFLILYYNCVKNISKCLSEFVEELSTFKIDCERCDSEYDAMDEIFENN
ncbi:hypothetical protein NBO_467g0008 [Nosema bombycis CQ1]|uniref:Uncharacterized protein n=1 Tax=Nosema bombycis (strain CQ1 / CVCC 102059) TaxID=578461 RepID=R0KQ26_NOSB1|nr:hypothetical protein NBO_467g0008 [Nosema bombycis CQ1]|eukprot:EOB12307.1 hypothetical protein NBO_467g0008 [Nosema bombycis CQ1]